MVKYAPARFFFCIRLSEILFSSTVYFQLLIDKIIEDDTLKEALKYSVHPFIAQLLN